jgi:hypothetical protein
MAQLTSSPKSLYADQDPWGIAARLSQRSHRQAESHAAFANGPALEARLGCPSKPALSRRFRTLAPAPSRSGSRELSNLREDRGRHEDKTAKPEP